MVDQMQILRQEIMDLNRQLCASQMVYDKYAKQSEQKGIGPALPDHPEPECTPEHRGPSSSSARAPSEHGTWVNSSNSDGHSDDERRLASLADEYGRIDGIPTADWIAQQRRAFLEQSEIPPEALEGETPASQQEKWERVQRGKEKRAKQEEKRAQQAAAKKIKRDSVLSGHNFAEMGSHYVRGRARTRGGASLTVPAAPLPSTAPQDRRPPKKGGHANPPGSQKSRLPPSPFPLPEGSPPLQDFALPMRFRKTTVRGMETSSDEEPQGEGYPPSDCRPARGPYRPDSPDEDGDAHPTRQIGRNSAQRSAPGPPDDKQGNQEQAAVLPPTQSPHQVPHKVFALSPHPKHTRWDVETDTLSYHLGAFPVYSGCQPEEGGFNPYMQAAEEAEDRRVQANMARLRQHGEVLTGTILESEYVELERPGPYHPCWKDGALPGGSPMTLKPKGNTVPDSVTAMYHEASHPAYDHMLVSRDPRRLRCSSRGKF
jgi:hypothetical protein